MKRTRIDIIRLAVLAEGGNYTERKDYYADGPTLFYGRSAIKRRPEIGNIVNYKIMNTGLELGAKERVIENLVEEPNIRNAWILDCGDIRVQFNSLAVDDKHLTI